MSPEATISLEQRWLWIGGSILLAIFAAWVRWAAARPPLPEWQVKLERSPAAPWLAQAARLLYAVGIPATVLLAQGQLTLRGLGLQPRAGLDWMRESGWSLALGVGALAIFALARRASALLPLHRAKRQDGWVALREAVYHQTHWAFYREPFVLLWGPALGAWAGLLPVALEAALNPARWADLRTNSPQSRALLFRAALAIISVLVYIQTQNFWLALLVDAVLGWATITET